MRQLRWTERASADLFGVTEYYKDIDHHLADLMLECVVSAPRLLLAQPAIGAPTGKRSTRRWAIRGTPYLLIYRILRDGTIEIMGVRHNRSNWRAI